MGRCSCVFGPYCASLICEWLERIPTGCSIIDVTGFFLIIDTTIAMHLLDFLLSPPPPPLSFLFPKYTLNKKKHMLKSLHLSGDDYPRTSTRHLISTRSICPIIPFGVVVVVVVAVVLLLLLLLLFQSTIIFKSVRTFHHWNPHDWNPYDFPVIWSTWLKHHNLSMEKMSNGGVSRPNWTRR